jgi:hypothetical protein
VSEPKATARFSAFGVQDLHREVAALAAIVDEFREETFTFTQERSAKAKQRRESKIGLTGGTERKLLEQQIQMLLQQGDCSKPGMSASRTQSDSKVLDYIQSSKRNALSEGLTLDVGKAGLSLSLPASSRPMSALSSARSGGGLLSARSLPVSMLLNSALGVDGCCEVEGGVSKLNAFSISGVVANLREAFAAEEVRLREEVEELMEIFEGENAHRGQVDAECKASEEAVPSTRELRDFSKKLQNEASNAPVTSRLLTTNERFGFSSSRTLPAPLPSSSSFSTGQQHRPVPNLEPLEPMCGRGSKLEFLRRPPLPTVPPVVAIDCAEALEGQSNEQRQFAKSTRSLSSRFKSEVACAALSAALDSHLDENDDDDERFWS